MVNFSVSLGGSGGYGLRLNFKERKVINESERNRGDVGFSSG